MADAFLFWLMKPLAEVAIMMAYAVAGLFIYGLFCLPSALKQRRCRHESVREDRACDAWCCACGKNLGFIGAWREKKAEQ